MSIKQRRQTILFTLAALVTLPAAVLYTNHAISNQPEAERQEANVPVPRVTVMPLQANSYRSEVQAYGEVKALDQISLASEINGRVIWRNPHFVVGGRLQKGDELIRLDATPYMSALANARQSLAEARLALQQEQRQKQQAERDWQRAGLKEQPSPLLLREPQLAVAKATLQAAQAAVAEAKRALAQTSLKAPFDAVVLSRDVATGSYLQQGAPVATLNTSARAEVKLTLSAEQLQKLPANPVGSPVVLSSQNQPGIRWQGRVDRLAQQIDPQTRLRTLVVSVDQPLDQTVPLLFGTFVQARLQGPEQSDLFALPTSALTAEGYLWYVTNEQLQRVKRNPAFSQDEQLFVQRGELPQKISLVLKPVSGYLPGMAVSTVEDQANLQGSEQ